MTAPSTVCPSCGEDVPFGRRNCEACGADVTAVVAPDDARSDQAPGAAELDDATGGAVVDEERWDGPPSADPAAAEWAAEPPPAEAWAATPAMPASVEPPPAEPDPAGPDPAPFVPPVLREWSGAAPAPETDYAARLAAAQAEPVGLAGAWLPPSSPASRSVPDSTADDASAWPDVEPETQAAVPSDAGRTPPNAMPASLAEMLERTSTGAPRWPGPAGSAVSDLHAQSAATAEPDTAMVPPSRMPDLGLASRPSPALPAEPRRVEPGRSPLFADLPFDAPNTMSGWLVAGGGGLATISFLLPWVAVIDSYFSAWGLGAISNLPAFLIVFGTTALAILPSRLADWLRHGILGLAVGSFILGITWNRLVGATGGQLGVILEATGALLLLIGGILAIVRDRGAAEGPRERG